MLSPLAVRDARADDALAMLEIYRPSIEQTAASFELTVPPVDEFRARVRATQEDHAWLVAVEGATLLGYAYGGMHRQRAAYRYTTEVSIYLAASARGRGVGRMLYERLFGALAARGLYNAVAGITLPNEASVAFHERMGFRHVGVYHGIGFKFGTWHDVGWYERRLADGAPSTPD